MDKKIREAQLKALKVFARKARTFALCGGTALELFYLKHRYSVDLDFISPHYNPDEIKNIVAAFKDAFKVKVKLEAEFSAAGRAQIRFYTIPVKGAKRPLKIDFAQDVLIKSPSIRKIKGVRIYSAKDIYLQKIYTLTGTTVSSDEVGRETMQGRRQSRDVFDVYMLSKKVMPLHIFLRKLPERLQRGMVHWYRTFPRQQLKLDLLDLDIYTKDFNSQEMIVYLENEIKKFVKDAVVE